MPTALLAFKGWADCGRMTGYSSIIGLGRVADRTSPMRDLARMSHPDPNGAPDRRPIKVGEVWENPVTGERS